MPAHRWYSRTAPAVQLLLIASSLCLIGMAASSSALAQGRVYSWGDAVANGVGQTFRIDLPGAPATLSLAGMDGGNNIDGVAVSPGGSMIAVGGTDQLGTNSVLNVYGPSGGAVAATLHSGDADDDYSFLTFSPDSAWVAFIADLDLNGANALYVVPSGGGTVKRVSQLPVSSATDVSRYAWASDSKTIVYRGDPVTDTQSRVWLVDATAVTPTPIDIVPMAGNLNVQLTLAFDANDRAYFISDYEVGGEFRLYRVDADGSNLEQVPGTALTHGGGNANNGTFGLSPDGQTLAFSSNSPNANIYQIYTMDLSGSTPNVVSNAQVIADASVRGPLNSELLAWSPDASKIAVLAGWDPGDAPGANDFSVFVVPSTPPLGGTRLIKSPGSNSDAVQVAFGSDTELIVRGDLVLNNDNELYVTSDLSTADQNPNLLVVQDVPVSGDVNGFVVPTPVVNPVIPNPDEPVILSITDVPNDEGKQVSIEWQASGLDVGVSQTPILEYAVFRQIDPNLTPNGNVEAAGVLGANAALLTGWHYLTSVPAFTDSGYAVVVPTLRDSTIDEGLYNTTFLVRAATATPSVFFDSAPDSGYSVDNLAPAAPMSLAFGAVRVLEWDAAPEADFSYHTIYGSPTQLLQDAALIGYTIDATFDVNATPNVYYLVTTTDHSGNEGLPAVLNDPGTVSTEGPVLPGAFALLSARPNPFRSATVIAFELPSAASVDARVFDSSGRAVRGLVNQSFPPGRHALLWDGTGDSGQRVAPGVYFVQVRAGGVSGGRTVVLVK